MASLILVRNVVGKLRPKRTLAASRGFLAAARLSCSKVGYCKYSVEMKKKVEYPFVHDRMICTQFAVILLVTMFE